jgi:hypothetical protein
VGFEASKLLLHQKMSVLSKELHGLLLELLFQVFASSIANGFHLKETSYFLISLLFIF